MPRPAAFIQFFKCSGRLSSGKIWDLSRFRLSDYFGDNTAIVGHQDLTVMRRGPNQFACSIMKLANADRLHVSQCDTRLETVNPGFLLRLQLRLNVPSECSP